MSEFLTVAEICRRLNVTRQTVIRWLRAGKLEGFRPCGSGRWRVPLDVFEAFTSGPKDRAVKSSRR